MMERKTQVIHTDEGFALHCEVSGGGPRILLCLHGGPGGSGGDYLAGLHGLATEERKVVTFDQLGTGGSDVPPAGYQWSIERAARDVENIRAELGVDSVDLLGHSWGGMLALEYTLRYPARVGRLILSNTVASTAIMETEFVRQLYMACTAADVDAALLADRENRHGDATFLKVALAWLTAYSANGNEVEGAAQLEEALDLGPAGRGLWGSTLWTSNAALKGWDAGPRLGEIRSPTLVVHGGRDMSTREINAELSQGIPQSEWITMNDSGHGMLDDENANVYLSILHAFLQAWPIHEEIR